ncbi:MAG: four helix bundle protein [Gemmatimonadetes bacterium]|nr:MAG: four helix bundle protein [Gemmatimonadota bacterium]
MYKYRSLEAWKHAHAAVIAVLRATDEKRQPKTWALFDQLRRAAVSVEANIVEGYALGTTPLYQRHLRIAVGSAAEAESLVRVAIEVEYLSDSIGKDLERQLGNALRTLIGLVRKRSSPFLERVP